MVTRFHDDVPTYLFFRGHHGDENKHIDIFALILFIIRTVAMATVRFHSNVIYSVVMVTAGRQGDDVLLLVSLPRNEYVQ